MDKIPQILDAGEKLKYRPSAKGLAIMALALTLPLLPIWIAVKLENLQDPVLLLAFGTSLLAFPYVWFITEFEIDNEGMRLYRFNVMKWDDVVSAKKVSLWGLKYLHVARRKGMKWMVPLFFNGTLPIEVALKEKCPAGNPIHQLFASDSQGQ